MRLPDTAYTGRSWRIHEIASDFRLEDVWALPTPGGPDDLERFAQQFTSDGGQSVGNSAVVSTLLEIRWKIGRLLGLDKSKAGIGERVQSLHDRLPPDLRDGPRGPDFQSVPFRSVYMTDKEWVSEFANRTVHAVMHVGWVADGSGGYRAQMATLVKPNGLFGKLYMAGILPMRRLIVFPLLIRSIRREWQKSPNQAGGG
jgi:hypothetical protein